MCLCIYLEAATLGNIFSFIIIRCNKAKIWRIYIMKDEEEKCEGTSNKMNFIILCYHVYV